MPLLPVDCREGSLLSVDANATARCWNSVPLMLPVLLKSMGNMFTLRQLAKAHRRSTVGAGWL
jgi:hypothetical protein